MNTPVKFGIDLYQSLIVNGFNYLTAQYITAQSAHETGNFTSQIFRQNNNLFGMKYAGQSLALGTKSGHAYYANIENSIRDYQTYYRLNNYLKVYPSLAWFVKTLKQKGYFTADEGAYLKGVTHFFNLYFGEK